MGFIFVIIYKKCIFGSDFFVLEWVLIINIVFLFFVGIVGINWKILMNVIVFCLGICCIGDLGFVVCYNFVSDMVDVFYGNRVGIKCYMFFEFFEDNVYVWYFDVYKWGDVYVFGFVLWEVVRKCVLGGICEEY